VGSGRPRGLSSSRCCYTDGETEAQGRIFLILSLSASPWGLSHRSGVREDRGPGSDSPPIPHDTSATQDRTAAEGAGGPEGGVKAGFGPSRFSGHS